MTGINTYTLHVLWCIWQCLCDISNSISADSTSHSGSEITPEIVGLGLSQSRRQELEVQFPFLTQIFTQHISLYEYFLGEDSLQDNKAAQSKKPWLHVPTQISNAWLSVQQSWGFHLTNSGCMPVDVLLQTQPKALPRHPDTHRIVTFHDVFAVEFAQFASLRQRVVENRQIYTHLAEDATTVITNSYATSLDIARLAPAAHSCIRWVYPALPVWDKLQSGTQSLTQAISTAQSSSSQSDDYSRQLSHHHLVKPFHHEGFDSYFLVISGCERRKNWSTIVQAYAQFCADNDNPPDLVFAGSIVDTRYLTELQQYVQQHNVKQVHFVGQVTEQDKKNLLKQAIAVVYPSLYEGFGFPILEAFAAKTPVITSTVGSMPEIADIAGILVDPLSSSELVTAFELVCDAQYPIDNKVQRGTQRLMDFDWQEMQRCMQEILFGRNYK